MHESLIWFGRIGMNTELRDIGWVWVILALVLIAMVASIRRAIKVIRDIDKVIGGDK